MDSKGLSGVDETHFVTVAEDRDLKRGLHQRHVSLIAIAGAIVRFLPLLILSSDSALDSLTFFDLLGHRSFLGAGRIDSDGRGRLELCWDYATVGLIVCAVQFALGRSDGPVPRDGLVRPPCRSPHRPSIRLCNRVTTLPYPKTSHKADHRPKI